jgi:hypothetical protein
MQTIVVVILVVVGLFIVWKIFKAIVKWVLIAVVVALAIAYFSNPDATNHKRSLKEVAEKLDVKIKDDAPGRRLQSIFCTKLTLMEKSASPE